MVVDNDQMQQWLDSDGSKTLRTQFYDSLNRDAVELTASEALPIIHGGSSITPQGISTHEDEAVSVYRAQVWSASRLSKYLNVNQSDPMLAIANDVAEYWAFRRQAYFLSTLAGILAMNDAAPTGGSTHTAGDYTLDVSAGSFTEGTTNFTAENYLNAVQLLGDRQGDLNTIMMHSITYNKMLKEDLIDFLVDSEGRATIKSYMGSPVIVNDEMPGAANVRHTYIFGPAVFGRAVSIPDDAVAVARSEEAGNGIGQESLFSRVRWALHPMGHRFVGTVGSVGGPTNAALATGTNWIKSSPERKQFPFVRLITREA
jgi:hypothetical protein